MICPHCGRETDEPADSPSEADRIASAAKLSRMERAMFRLYFSRLGCPISNAETMSATNAKSIGSLKVRISSMRKKLPPGYSFRSEYGTKSMALHFRARA